MTDVVISSDLSYLDVFVSALKNEELLAKTLAKYNDDIQGKYNRIVKIRKLPRIRYRYDDKGKVGQGVCEVINELKI
ncbi:MAG: ribosome-binding factor A [Candidatus Peribacteria bacterium]|nr:ribosome-binding factor A [Candidatus Peribacteria bacterium]